MAEEQYFTSAKKVTTITAGIVLVVWLGLVVIAFWWFQFRYLGNFRNHFVSFDGASLNQPLPEYLRGAIRVAHILDPKCPCTRFSRDHVSDMEERYAGRVNFSRWEELPNSFVDSLVVPASPAVAVWDSQGELAYFGPYSGGAFCGEGEDFVDTAINMINAEENPRWINHDTLGCFCPYSLENKGA